VHAAVCATVRDWWAGLPGWLVLGVAESPLRGPEGNVEFLIGAMRKT
jgi:23S rRNA (cytidine1920-2'-O)/16S rRNA (cytidine1409-2'-O)-methyltransferase